MENESTSFWADIKKYEDTLARDPGSYCFAPLSELYRKLGLLDDAIGVAQRGTDVHPEYVGGYMALGRAYFEKGVRDKAREALERVVKATPDNHLAQKLIYRIYREQGDDSAAEHALRCLVTFNPEDVESRLELDALLGKSLCHESVAGLAEEEGELILDDSSMEDADETMSERDGGFPDVADVSGFAFQMDTNSEADVSIDLSASGTDESSLSTTVTAPPSPLPTLTLAELFASQGSYKQALGVYERLQQIEPDNELLTERIAAIRSLMEGAGESIYRPPAPMELSLPEENFPGVLHGEEPVLQHQEEFKDDSRIIEALEGWLASIRRIRECR